MAALKLLEVAAKKISSSQINAQNIVTDLFSAKILPPVNSGFEKARKGLRGEFKMSLPTM